MKLSKLSLLALLPAYIAASPLHDHHHHKRGVDIVTDIVTVIVDANGKLINAPTETEASTTSTSVGQPVYYTSSSSSSTTSWSAAPTTLVTSAATTESEPEYTSTSTSSSSSSSSESQSATSASSASSSSSTLTGVGAYAAKGKGISYSPYTKSGDCKTAEEVATDFETLQDFGIIRLYDVDCSGVENVLAAKADDQKLFIGIYSIDEISSAVDTLEAAIAASANGWSDVYTISVGNELVNSGEATVAEVQIAFDTAKTLLTAIGYTGPLVAVDTLVAVQDNTGLCEISDYIAVNSHAYWDGSVYPENAGSWLLRQIEDIYSTCGSNKSVLITETGWPTSGDTYGVAVPSVSNQLSAIESISDACADSVLFFTPYNDYWKAAGSYDVEQSWGIFGNPSS